MAFKITEIRIMAGKDVIIYEPNSITFKIGGKSGSLPEKAAAKIFKAIAAPAEQYFELFRNTKPEDFEA